MSRRTVVPECALEELARRVGVQTTYMGHDGRRRRASPETLAAVLDALGVAVDGSGDAGSAPEPIEPVLFRRGRARCVQRCTLPAKADPASVYVHLDLEDGSRSTHRLASLVVADAPSRLRPIGGRPPSAGVRGAHLLFELPPVPDGYHRVVLEGAARTEAAAVLVAAPARSPRPARAWGVFAPLHALRARGDWGVGSYRDLGEFCRSVADAGAGFVGTLPLLATFNDGAQADPSPYRPVSRLAWNELHLDVEALVGSTPAAEARRLLAGGRLRAEAARLRRRRLADPAATMALKRPVLEALATAVFEGTVAGRSELEAFCAARPHLLAYALFRATFERTGRRPSRTRLPRAGRVRLPGRDDPAARYHLYVQWAADAQLAALDRSGLYLDLPVGVHPDGFDPWWAPEAFVSGASAGAPPDNFFSGGQVWGLRPLHPAGLRATGYRYLAEALRHTMRRAGVVRIDHVMGLHRMWFVPDGAAATDGVYVRYRAEELRAVVVLEAARAGVGVVGEDLGTVPAAVRAGMRHDGMLRSHVHQFAASPADPLPSPGPDTMASLGTHDLPTFASWWSAADVDEAERRGLLTPVAAGEARARRAAIRRALHDVPEPEALRACLLAMAASDAALVSVDPGDLWGELEPQNRPGTSSGNFRRRWTKPATTFLADPAARGLLAQIDEARRAGDSPSPRDAPR